MIHRVLKIGRWVVDFLFALEHYDPEGALACLYDAGAPKRVMERAKQIMEKENPNTGFTFANPISFRAVVVVGPASSGREFVDTTSHELYHLATAIASELGVDLEGEAPAYLMGDSMRALMDVVCMLGCSQCNKNSRSSHDGRESLR